MKLKILLIQKILVDDPPKIAGRYTLQRGNLFYTSLENKKLSEPNTIAGFVTELSDDGKSITFKPVTNNENNIIEYTYKTEVNNTTNIVAEKTLVNSINLPLGSEGKINIQINLNSEYFCTFDYQFNTLWIKQDIMDLLSFNFLILLAITFIFYYVLPKKVQWLCLLTASFIFYYFRLTTLQKLRVVIPVPYYNMI